MDGTENDFGHNNKQYQIIKHVTIMERILKTTLLIALTIMLSISVVGQSKYTMKQLNREMKRQKKESEAPNTETIHRPYRPRTIPKEVLFDMEMKRREELERSNATIIPCSNFQDNEEFIYATYQEQSIDLQMARRAAMDGVQFELMVKLSNDERYKELINQGISYNINTECEEMARIELGYIVYIAVSVSRKELDAYKN